MTWPTPHRPHQITATDEILDHFRSGVKTVFLDGPPGCGKTRVAEMVRRQLDAKGIYICSSKTLQDQFSGDYPEAKVVKGRANYRSLNDRIDCSQCDNFKGICVSGCGNMTDRCPYMKAKREAGLSKLAVLNTTYFLYEANQDYDKTMFGAKRFNLGVFDECDVLEAELMRYVEVGLSARTIRRLGVGLPKLVTKPESWYDWLEEKVYPALKRTIRSYPVVVGIDNPEQKAEYDEWVRIQRAVRRLRFTVVSGNWVFDEYRTGAAMFRPVRVGGFGEYLWSHFPRVLLMSGTIISAEEMADSLGIGDDYAVVRAPMTFPVENRRVHVAPVANMTAKTAEEEWPKMAKGIGTILAQTPRSQRVLVHTVSYKLAEYLEKNVETSRPVVTYQTALGRDNALETYRRRPGAVIFAPSLDRGVDFRDSDCRVVVVAKMPYLSLGDKQTSARLHSRGGQTWFAVQTIRSLVQSTGRGVRHDEDFCVGYILDAQFLKVLKQNRSLIPKWWLEALNTNFNVSSIRGEK